MAKAKYKKNILLKKRNGFKQFILGITNSGIFSAGYKIIKDSRKNDCIENRILKEEGTLTESIEEDRKEILMHNFTSCDEEDYVFNNVDDEDNKYNNKIDILEIKRIISEINVKKATGIDGISGDMIKLIYKVNKHVFMDLFNKIWNSYKFPNSWKIAVVTLIPKEGKDLRLKDRYKPISLLLIWGKVFDKFLTNRLMTYLEDNRLLDDR